MSRETNFKRPVTFSLTGKVKKIQQIALGALKAPGVKPATYGDFGLNGSYSFAKDDENSVSVTVPLPRDMDKLVAPSLGIGWSSPATTGNVYWRIQYLYRGVDEDTSSVTPDESLPSAETVSSTANGYKFKYFQLGVPSATDRIIVLKISRLGADDLDTADNVANQISLHSSAG